MLKCFLLHTNNIRKERKAIQAVAQVPLSKNLEIDICRPEAEDVTRLCELLVQYFGYVYQALFGTSEKLTFRVMTQILAARNGKHSLGYQSFHIARRKDTREVVGILLLKMAHSCKLYSRLLDVLTIPTVVLMNLGLIGLLRTGSNWMILHRLAPKLKPNELHIVYLAVADGARYLHVGQQLLNYAKTIASEEGKQLMTLCVREKNVDAQDFFLSYGFYVESVLPDKRVDRLLGQGSSIRMIASV